MTVIQAAPRVPKGLYRPAEVQPPLAERAGGYLPEYEQDPYIHPAYAKAYRRPPSPIAEGRFVPDRDSTPVRRSRSTSTRRTHSTSGSRSKSVPAQPEAPSFISERAHVSSPDSPADPPSERSSRRGSPRSVASSAPLETPPSGSPVLPTPPTAIPIDTPAATSVPVLVRPSKLKKPRRSTETVGQSVKSQERELREASTLVEPPTSRAQSAKSRSAFSRFRFGKAAAERSPPQVIATGDGSRRLSKASSYVVVDVPEPSIAEVPENFYSQAAPGSHEVVRDSAYLSSPYHHAPSIRSWESGSHAGQALKPPPAAMNLGQIDELDETAHLEHAWNMPGPYDVVRSTAGSRIGGSVVGGSQVGSQVGASRRRQAAPSIAGSSVRDGHRVLYSDVGASHAANGAPVASPYPPNMAFIPEALPSAQAKAYSDASHSRSGSSGSQNRSGGSAGEPILPVLIAPSRSQGSRSQGSRHGYDEGTQQQHVYEHWDTPARPVSSYDDLYVHPDDRQRELPRHDWRPDDEQDDFYTAPRFEPHPDDHSSSARDSQWADAPPTLYPRRSRGESMKFVPAPGEFVLSAAEGDMKHVPGPRRPLMTPPDLDVDDHRSHRAHHSQIYSDHASHRRGPSSMLSGNSGGSRGPMPRTHVPHKLVMPSPLQQQLQVPSAARSSYAPPSATHGAAAYRSPRSPPQQYSPPGIAYQAHGYGAVDSARHSAVPSWQSTFAHQADARGGRLQKRSR